jgi:flagellar biosynthesis protein FlhF
MADLFAAPAMSNTTHPQAERFRGADLSRVADRARRTLGDDVMILHTRTVREGGIPMVEVLAAPSSAIDRVRSRLTPAPLPTTLRKADGKPFCIALVGPTGAGKTTTAAKLAVKRGLFGASRCGLLTIDTYRVGGMEQLATYAELADVPFEVIYDEKEVDAAMKRLSAQCDVIIVDTPGRSPNSAELTERWRSLLDAIGPDEVHLVLPASLRADLAVDVGRNYSAARAAKGGLHRGATHLLITKLDEVPRETGVADLALSLAMPTRWIADGQDVPADLGAGVPRLLRSWGLSADAEADWMPA